MARDGVTLSGERLLFKSLDEFDRKIQRNALSKARDAAKEVASDAKQLAPQEEGTLGNAIRVRVVKQRPGQGRGIVGASVIVAERYAGFLEFGTADRYQASGRYTGQIEKGKFDFLRPALYTNGQRVFATFRRSLKAFIGSYRRRST